MAIGPLLGEKMYTDGPGCTLRYNVGSEWDGWGETLKPMIERAVLENRLFLASPSKYAVPPSLLRPSHPLVGSKRLVDVAVRGLEDHAFLCCC